MTNHSENMGYPAATAVEDELGGIKEGARRAAKQVKAAAADGADALSEAGERAADGLKARIDDGKEFAAAMREVVRERPLTAIAAVALVAWSLGRMIQRR